MINRKLKNKAVVLFILLILPVFVFSQKWKIGRYELIGGIGTSSYFGDIGGSKSDDATWVSDLDIMSTRPNINVGLRYRIDEWGTVRGNLTYGMLKGFDEGSKNEARGYSFSTNLFELTGYFEYWFIKEKQMVQYSTMNLRDGLRKFNASISAYVFVGIGAAYFNPVPKEKFIGSSDFVGDKNFGIVLPVGIGVKYPLSSRNFIGFEFAGRLTSTDYIDGLDRKGSEHNDVYYFTSLYLTHKIKPKMNKSRRKY